MLAIQDGTGSRTLSFNAIYEFKDDTAPTLTTTAAKGDVFVFRYNGSKWLEVGRNQNLTFHNMYALVESESITKLFPYPKGFVLNNTQYSQDIFYKWTKAEKEAIGIYEVETDSTNYKDKKWYINTNESLHLANNKVIRSWGTATAKAHSDSLFTAQDRNRW